MRSASLVLNSPLTGIITTSSFFIRFITEVSTAPVPDVVSTTISFSVSNTVCVLLTISLYNFLKSSLLWFIIGVSIALITLLGTLVGPGSITRYSNYIHEKIIANIYNYCLLYTSDAADERSSVDLG